MNDLERERNMPVFIFISMVVHSLLFLYGPQIASTLLPAFQPGDQGGLSYVTLIDAAPVSQARAAVPRSAVTPQSTPEPRERPEPRPAQAQAVAPPSPPPAPEPARQGVSAPQSPAVSPAERPQVSPAPAPAPAVESRPSAPEPVQESTTAGAPVLTSERAPVEIPETLAPRVEPAPAAPQEASEGAAQAAGSGSGETVAGPEESGSGALEDVPSSSPGAEPSPEPALPPTGLSMVNSFGGAIFPKDAVGLITGVVTVEVAAVVSPEGRVIETVVIRPSGIDYIDNHAQTLASRGIQFKPYQEAYEIRVMVTYNGRESTISYDVGDFIRVPPTVGSTARP